MFTMYIETSAFRSNPHVDTSSPGNFTSDDEPVKQIIFRLEQENFGREPLHPKSDVNDQSNNVKSLDPEEQPSPEQVRKKGRRGPKVGTEGKKKKPGFHETFHRRKMKHPYPCVYCPADFDTESDRVDHLKETHCKEKSVICVKCGKVFANNNVKSKHLPKCGKVPEKYHLPPFICQFCGREFETYRIQIIHEKHVHATSRPYSCDLCSFTGKTAACVVIHKKQVHTPTAKVKCEECNQILKSQLALDYHIKRMHTPDGNEKYQEQHRRVAERRKGISEQKQANLTTFCTDCNIDFQTVHRMVKHRLKEHTLTDARFQCEECGKSFIKSRSFWKHRKTVHNDERPHVCDRCGSSFKVLNSLTNHLSRVHSEEGRQKYNEYNRVNYRRKRKIEEVLTVLEEDPVPRKRKSKGPVLNAK
ncbi:unnamed protein product [Allacma fusca]|uniref:C2H2-type domain-containing protein n=1 Tax=Allacma fusca TaxID=39272 RepID=A0A8J2PHE3_9HEXA|nr:unnamed protein product [Allacma fusca]